MSRWLLRNADADDRAAILDLWVAAWTVAMPSIDFEARRPWLRDRLTELEGSGGRTVVACEADAALGGFLVVTPATHYLDQIAVRPDLRGTGLARTLLDRAKSLSPERLELHVNRDNPRAVRFYEREGFGRLGAGVNPRSGLPVWHMRWPGGSAP